MKRETAQHPGAVQGVLLLLCSTLPVMGVVVLTPVLPSIMAAFAGTPHVDVLAPVALTIPALCIAIFSPLAGWMADRIGRRLLLLAAMVLYALLGMAPMMLNSLPAIIVSRVGVGLTEAVIMTVSTALIGDYFDGAARQKWLSYQTAATSIAATVLFLVGGLLGSISWRAPFAVYGLSFVLFCLAVVLLHEPVRSDRTQDPGPLTADGGVWRAIGGICVLTVAGAAIFYLVPVQIGFVLGQHGVTSPAVIGAATALGSVALALGAIAFRWRGALSLGVLLGLCFGIAGLGLIAMVHAAALPVILCAVLLNQAGCGLMLPLLLAWAMSRLAPKTRGQGTGLWTGAFFLGQFISPLVVVALTKAMGGLLPAIQSIGLFGVAAGAASLLVLRKAALPPLDVKAVTRP